MGWDESDKKSKETGGKFIKMAGDGDSCKGVLMGEPTCEETFYDKKEDKTRAFTEDDEKAGEKPSLKFKFNLFTLEVNDDELEKPEMRILTVSPTTYRAISMFRKKAGGDLGWKPVTIIRNGKAKDTKTTYNVSLSENDLSKPHQKIAKAAKLHNLEDDSSLDSSDSAGSSFDTYSQSKEADDGPLTKEEATKLSTPYRDELKDELPGFLTKFGIQRFKDLKVSQLEEATAYTRSLQKTDEADEAEGLDAFA